MAEKKNIAMLIDADNSPAKSIEFILSELAKYGTVNVRRAYGNWASSNLKSWAAILHEHAIQPIQQYDLIKGKNATDIAMTIDAMDMLYTKQIDTFCIVTSDCDFTPLSIRLLSEGKTVIGFGERKTPSVFVNACSTFLFLDQEEPGRGPKKVEEKALRGDTKLLTLIREAISATSNHDGWAMLAAVGLHISNRASFDPRNYGYSRLSDLIQAVGLFEIRRDANMAFEVKDRRSKQSGH
ncbi:MAG: NYN domain-containing protein [Desulfobacterales bacterium]|nr:NYN domain-containing protein [Desulfobacterales bacterium]